MISFAFTRDAHTRVALDLRVTEANLGNRSVTIAIHHGAIAHRSSSSPGGLEDVARARRVLFERDSNHAKLNAFIVVVLSRAPCASIGSHPYRARAHRATVVAPIARARARERRPSRARARSTPLDVRDARPSRSRTHRFVVAREDAMETFVNECVRALIVVVVVVV